MKILGGEEVIASILPPPSIFATEFSLTMFCKVANSIDPDFTVLLDVRFTVRCQYELHISQVRLVVI